MSIEFVRSKRLAPTLDLAPLIDVVFQLLIFFMLSASFARPVMPLALPHAGSGEQTSSTTPLVISAAANGHIWFNDEPVMLEALRDRLAAAAALRPDQPVRFEGDGAVPYQLFLRVTEIARECGIIRLDLAFEPEVDAASP